MNLATLLILGILTLAVIWILVILLRSRRSGKCSCGCSGCSCSGCPCCNKK